MHTSPRADRRVYAAAPYASVALLSTVLLTGRTSSPQAKAAWDRYVKAEAAYENCQSRRHPDPLSCHAEQAVLEADRARYHADADAQR